MTCLCGCGVQTPNALRSRARLKQIKGQPLPYVPGHRPKKAVTVSYRAIHHRKEGLLEDLHRLRAEAALGRPLPTGAIVHHADGTKGDSSPLVICQDHAYHMLLHVRMRVRAAGGNPNTDHICGLCKRVRPISAMGASKDSALGYSSKCRECLAAQARAWRASHPVSKGDAHACR